MNEKYDHKDIEKKWKKKWQAENLYQTTDEAKGKENFYALTEFPYPSGNLHIGHWYAFAVPDIFVRMKRMQNFNVMFPIGFDSFGLPAENAAIKHGVDPRKWTYENIDYMENQLQSMGNSFDWSRKVITSDPEYYKWTQWLFLEFFKKGLAYKNKANVNWCPSCDTVLANEQVVTGKCERCGSEVVQKDLDQWFFKTTAYAEKLLNGLDDLNWPNSIKEAQRNWIGKSEGTEISFKLKAMSLEEEIKVFTTRVDTLYGVTYLVLAPEHPLIEKLSDKIENLKEVQKYIQETKAKTEIERTDAKKEKTGVEVKGVKAVNPANSEEVPIFVADYVLYNYGTGAVMAVPAHDDRDFEFAKKYNLPIREVIIPHFIDHKNPHQPNKDVVFRKAVIVILRNSKDGKILCLRWKKQPWTTFITGGIEEGESPAEAAERELKEETGFQNFKLVQTICGPTQAEFFAAHKNVNRVTNTWTLLFELKNDEQKELAPEEAKIHNLEWLDYSYIKEKGRDLMAHAEIDFILDKLENEDTAFTGEGVLINSEKFDGMKSGEARKEITKKFGEGVIKYKLRDWLLSRQRYWGCPIPIVYDPEGKPHQIPEEHLPWLLPDDIDLTVKGESPLATSKELKERVEKIFGKGWRPEVDTMDTFVDSSWYFLRYTDPKNEKEFADKKKMKKWMPVGRYSGGAEHTNMHLLYSRFFHKALFDLGLVNEDEPFKERMNRGLILGPDGQKMSKSKGNVIDPDKQVQSVGADTVRMYLAFIGPFNEEGQYPWDLGGIVGTRRFLEKVWKISLKLKAKSLERKEKKSKLQAPSSQLQASLHKTIKKVGEDIENFKFNTAISTMMIFINELDHTPEVSKGTFDTFLKLLAPFAPYMTEELWNNLGHKTSIHLEKWPKFNEAKVKEDKITIVIQVNGKVRGQIETEIDADEETVKEKALALPAIQKWLENKKPKKVIFVQNKIINFVF